MTSFLNDVLNDLNDSDLSNLTFIMPSKRAGVFLKHEISNYSSGPLFSPEIYSIEEFVENLSQLKPISNIELLFEFYSTYKALTPIDSQDNFETFSKWAQILLQDFNEIDRYQIAEDDIFDYLSAIQEINHWSLDNNPTKLVSNYLAFWKKLKNYYNHLTKELLSKGMGYQGLIYREAVENIQNYMDSHASKKHLFIGFNALNTSEEIIMQELLQNNMADIYWDIDETFYKNQNHDAGFFARKHITNWKFYKNNEFKWLSNNYKKQKDIYVIGVPKNVGQSKHISTILKTIQNYDVSLNKTAIVLGEESLLAPILNSIPKSITALNITMGLPLKSIPLTNLFQNLFLIHKSSSKSFYYKDVINILSHTYIAPLLQREDKNDLYVIKNAITENNLIYLTKSKLTVIAPQYSGLFELLFDNWDDNIDKALDHCQTLILKIKESLNTDKKKHVLALEYLFHLNTLFNELETLNSKYGYLTGTASLYLVFNELLSLEKLDFKGEPLSGLQIMGMLESRTLDFETVIISSVNEGILPAGKTQNSFIPFDVKLDNELPTYKEKDAIYAYHFYRLIQRAKKVYILYNTEVDTFSSGEKSRFIAQMELEGIHDIKHEIVVPKVPLVENKPIEIGKTSDIINTLQSYAAQGFSPSSLTNYIRNPIDFYLQKILKIKEQDDVEETIASNTLGTVIHNTLEDFYKPFVGQQITSDDLQNMKHSVDNTVEIHFQKLYKEGDIKAGKNLIIFEIAKRYISNFLDLELTDLKNGNTIEILAVEAENKIQLDILELDFPVFLKGTVDRVDKRNGIVRIIDYKSGRVDKNKVEIIDWQDITTDYDKYSKSFQVLSYALMMDISKNFSEPVEAGIISFKNLNSGFLKFAKKDRSGAYAKKIEFIDESILNDFYSELKKLIIEICNPEIPFLEKEIK
ncbi:PD-(D/E)XK nuclease family protein [Hanstruepera neustonica]|uniref:PD-(D/E)XK nuclease family protein n=1 Tax=Hanstruepera neustonica TaxID=1445657 RepID=A0A2K1E3S3_9FLAO|nr:PD-(D/E)XK nuclease family protein [Hanstruepera neustonica]PNQ74871.1 PD-(D/E)XK nuclease family protein [Hanstruepera neustonica]